jgi:hypothetical protein
VLVGVSDPNTMLAVIIGLVILAAALLHSRLSGGIFDGRKRQLPALVRRNIRLPNLARSRASDMFTADILNIVGCFTQEEPQARVGRTWA